MKDRETLVEVINAIVPFYISGKMDYKAFYDIISNVLETCAIYFLLYLS